MSRRVAAAAWWCTAAVAVGIGCRDSPREMLETATEAAARGDVLAVRESLSVASQQRLERAWDLSQTPHAKGWEDLAQKLTFDGGPLRIGESTIRAEYARVMTRAGPIPRAYFLRKENGYWRIELGAGIQFRKLAPRDAVDAAVPPR